MLREDERSVGDDVVLALCAGDRLRFVPCVVQLGRETRGPFVIAASDGAVEDFDVRHTSETTYGEQALTNMLDNAFRHGGGQVTLAASHSGGTVEFHVLDEGGGFPEAFLARAFERFSRADPTRPDGNGLGLAIVESVALAHGGQAHAVNRSGGGADVSSVTLRFKWLATQP